MKPALTARHGPRYMQKERPPSFKVRSNTAIDRLPFLACDRVLMSQRQSAEWDAAPRAGGKTSTTGASERAAHAECMLASARLGS